MGEGNFIDSLVDAMTFEVGNAPEVEGHFFIFVFECPVHELSFVSEVTDLGILLFDEGVEVIEFVFDVFDAGGDVVLHELDEI